MHRPRPRGETLAVAGLLAVALGLRVWGIKHGLPYVYNVDEGANFVRSAVGFFAGDYNPHYFVNPPGFTYLLHGVFAVWFGGGWPFDARDAVSDAYATNPTEIFVVARVTSALLGTAAVAFVYATGKRLWDWRVGLIAGALMAVAFLPVFYSHLALNDVPALLPLAVSVWGSAGVLRYGRARDYLIAGGGLGLAAATKYTAGIVLLPLLAAAAFHFGRSRASRTPVLAGIGLAGASAVAAFVVANPHALFSFSEFWTDVKRQESAAGDLGKLGLSYDSGVHYYGWVVTWGIGWAPALAALAGIALLFRYEPRKALFLVPWPVAFLLFMGLQDRYFGRWLLPALPAIALLAAYASVRLADAVSAGRRGRGTIVLVGLGALMIAQGLVYDVHVDRVLSRDDTRNMVREWMVRTVPAGAKIVVEPVVPDGWVSDAGPPPPVPEPGVTPAGRRWRKLIATRTTLDEQGRRRRGGVGRTIRVEDYERTTRPELVDAYARGGFCWIVIGSTQYGRAFADPEEVPRALRYYTELGRRAQVVYRVSPYERGQGPVKFNFDWSFDYYPMAYERPGPTMIVYRLREGDCAKST